MRFLGRALVASAAVSLSAVQLLASPTVQVIGVARMQPGWVRVYLKAGDAPEGVQYGLYLMCHSPTDRSSVSSAQTTGSVLGIDIKVNANWLADSSLPQPCHISHLTVYMQANEVVYAQASQDADISMDLPLSLMTPGNTSVAPAQASVPLAPSQTYAAYPPLFVAIQSATGLLGFAEVEELPERKTVGLRGLSVFSGSNPLSATLVSELGGGGEIPPGWGLDINLLQIWRAPQLPIETTNPGHDTFPYSGSTQPAILALNTLSNDVFPWPPLYTEADYEQYVLSNRGAKRCHAANGCMDVTYDTSNSSNHTLDGVGGAKLALIAPPPIVLGAQTNMSRRSSRGLEPMALPAPAAPFRVHAVAALPSTSAKVIASLDPEASKRLLEAASQLSAARTGNFDALLRMPTALSSSRARMKSNASTRDRSKLARSPQETLIVPGLPKPGGGVTPVGGTTRILSTDPTASCVINGAGTVTQPLSGCNGMSSPSASGFVCPTVASPIVVEQIGATTDQAAALTGTIPPYYAGRDNMFGTCGSHAFTQYAEALFDKYTDDLAIKRVIYVDGDGIVVPEPRVAQSVTGGLDQLYIWDGTQSGDPPNSNWPPSTWQAMPQYPEAYWPAREGNWQQWVDTAGQEARPKCDRNPKNFWKTGFCLAQGHPAQGVYMSHTIMAGTLNGNPLIDPPWSLANTYTNTLITSIPVRDPDAAIQAVLAEIRLGLPLNLGFDDSPGGALSYSSGPTWYLPPEVGACSIATLNAAYQPGGGHWLNIVGYWISGASTSPNLFNSYFILENNHGKTDGYHSFSFMNFAAFEYLTTQDMILNTYRLDRVCWSVACSAMPPPVVPPRSLKQLLYPPDPESTGAKVFWGILNDARAQLGGVAGTSVGGKRSLSPPEGRSGQALK